MNGFGKIVLILILVVGLAATGYGVYAVYDERKRKSGTGNEPVKEPATGTGIGTAVSDVFTAIKASLPASNTTTTSATKAVFPLQKGSRGPEVTIYQIYLNTRYGAGLDEDGIWGSKTQDASLKTTGLSSVSLAQYKNFVSILETYHKTALPKPATAMQESAYGGYSSATIS